MYSRGSYAALQHMSVDTLVKSAQAGDGDAFGELMMRHSGLIRRTAYSVLRNAEDAEDIVQEVALKGLRNIHAFEGKAAFSTWLTRIAFNASLARLRYARCRPSSSLDALSESEASAFLALSDASPNPEEQCLAMDGRRRLELAIARLPIRLQDVVFDHLYEDMSMAEVARKRALSLAAAKSRSCRARKRLVMMLSPQPAMIPSQSLEA
ncbi:RNA polymerase sigma factor [Silvibacterium sp.]|uniref:RNA polymerase sigma factor n=1 Tax=Silvibacterium sp. TaxID=1964179 RepID=UPI0039E58C59